MSYLARSHIHLADVLLVSGQIEEATNEVAKGCSATARLVATDSSVQEWRAQVRDCWDVRARLSLEKGDLQQALRFAERALETAKSVRSADPVDSRYSLAQAYRVLGDIRRRLSDARGAQAAWRAGIGALPANVVEKPHETAERVILLHRLGRLEEAREGAARLAAIGYRLPELGAG
jgi:tetratricopeptide (TPR) repeat protein